MLRGKGYLNIEGEQRYPSTWKKRHGLIC